MINYKIFRFNPFFNNEPFIENWYFSSDKENTMLLDDLFYLKDSGDEALSFRRSCREGICGSCAMNVNGKNALACTHNIIHNKETNISIYPLPHMPIIRDLVVNMKHFYEQYKSIDPFLKISKEYNLEILYKHFNKKNIIIFLSKPSKENYQSIANRSLIDGLYECILCACCSTSCPSYWWNRDKYLGPAILLQAYRWIVDSRDLSIVQRLNLLNDHYKLYRCHSILNRMKCCPKNLNPAEAISNIKSIISLL